MSDPIADLLTRVRNAGRALLPTVNLPHSKLKENIARLLVREGYLAGCSVGSGNLPVLHLQLKYSGRCSVIEGLRRVSRPGLRQYVGVGDLPRVLGGLGIAIMSTPGGVMTATEARRHRLGGEVLCYVW